MPPVRTGLDALRDAHFAPLRGRRVGLVCHPASVDAELRHAADLLAGAAKLVALFGPEHGFHGTAQDLIGVADTVAVHSLYGATVESLRPTAAQLAGLDALVIDLQDVGSRYYTFQATMLYCLEAAAEAGLPVMILDRPNPLGGEVEGPTLRAGFESFVGPHPICTRHGMTMGELATLYVAEKKLDVSLQVVLCEHWQREEHWPRSMPWLPPSPNIPTLDTVAVYPGMCLIEGTNLSEGRGTTRPFEYVGFPGVNPHELVERLQAHAVPRVQFLPVSFCPTFQKHAGKTCGGVFLFPQVGHQPVRMGLAVLMAFRDLLGERFRWRTERYEFVEDIPAIDLLFGSDRERKMIEAGASWQEIARQWEPEEAEFRERRKSHLVYRS